VEDQRDLNPVYDPTHPDADENGYVMRPNVDLVKETTDAMSATRSYEANITAFNAMKTLAQKALEIGK
jgi:flagellar basal-body rod protein FlgC